MRSLARTTCHFVQSSKRPPEVKGLSCDRRNGRLATRTASQREGGRKDMEQASNSLERDLASSTGHGSAQDGGKNARGASKIGSKIVRGDSKIVRGDSKSEIVRGDSNFA